MTDAPLPLLSVKGLNTRFHTLEGDVHAVKNVDFDILPGETLGLVGESGCGKSVTSLSIMRLLNPANAGIRGQVRFKDMDLLGMGNEAMRRIRGKQISMIFQEPMTSLNPVLTVGEQIAEIIRLHEGLDQGAAWDKAIQMLRKVQIPSPEVRAGQYPHKLSGGMRQRAMIAMALACSPALIFADEPTTALDVTIQAQIIRLLNQLKRDVNTAIVLITHDLGVIARMATRVVVMYAGQVVEEAPVVPLFHDTRHPYTQGLLRSIPGTAGLDGERLAEIPGRVPNLLRMPAGCSFHPRCSQAMEICQTQPPPMVHLGPNRRVACWLSGDSGDETNGGAATETGTEMESTP